MSSELPNQLVRSLGLRSTFFLVVGSCVGSGVFLVASDIARAVPGTLPALSVWVAAGIISLVGALVLAELGSIYPDAGGQYVYLTNAFHPLVGFLFGWTLILVIQAGSISAIAIAVARFSSGLFGLDAGGYAWIASASIVGLTLLNMLGMRRASKFLDGITSLKMAAILLFGIIGIWLGASADFGSSRSVVAEPSLTFSSYGVALIAAFWSYDGWNNLSFVAGEIRDPKRNIPLAFFFGILSTTAMYVLVNTVYYQWLNPSEIAASGFVAADAAVRLGGPTAAQVITLMVAISSIGCVNALVLGGARVIYALAASGFLPQWFGRLNPQTNSPNNALLAQMIWTVLLVFSGTYDQLFTYVIFAAFLFYGLTAAALFRLRQTRPNIERGFRMPLYPWLPAAYLVFCVAFACNAIVEKPWEAMAGLFIIGIGVPVYFFVRERISA